MSKETNLTVSENKSAELSDEPKFTLSELKEAIQQCKWRIQECPGEPPEGYDPDDCKVADACWLKGMDELGVALENWASDLSLVRTIDQMEGKA